MSQSRTTVKPWAIALVTILSTFAGAMVKDKLLDTADAAQLKTQVQVLQVQAEELKTNQKSFIDRNEYQQGAQGTNQRLDDIKSDVQEIKKFLYRSRPLLMK